MDEISPVRDTVDAAKVREIRRLKGLRWDWLAGQVGVSSSLLSRMLSGDRKWTAERVKKLAEALNVPVHEVLR